MFTSAPISAEAFSEEGQRLKIALKNEDLLIASKVPTAFILEIFNL